MSDKPLLRRVEPTVSLLQGKAYTNAANTNLKALFERIRAEAEPKQRPRRIK